MSAPVQRLGLIALAVFAAVAGLALSRLTAPGGSSPLTVATAYPQPRALAPFALVDHQGDPFTEESLRGNWQLLFFGFTHCPDVCPLTLNTLAQAVAPEAGETQALAEVVLVSVDPERDTPERLGAYVSRFGEGFLGVTGSAEAIADFTASAAIAYAKVPLDDQGSYTMDHSAAVLAVDPSGRIHAVFNPPPPLVAPQIRDDLKRLRERYASP
ncbi:MAG: SCO family protein [Pseudomonadota bacterium]